MDSGVAGWITLSFDGKQMNIESVQGRKMKKNLFGKKPFGNILVEEIIKFALENDLQVNMIDFEKQKYARAKPPLEIKRKLRQKLMWKYKIRRNMYNKIRELYFEETWNGDEHHPMKKDIEFLYT